MISEHKKVFIALLLCFSLLIAALPFLVTINDLLTKIVENNRLYIFIQNNIVPLEAKMIGAILIPFDYKYAYSPSNAIVVVNGLSLKISWNCIGWQSFLFLFVTFIVGFRGRYSKSSLIEAFLIGILGTFWLNIIRMLFTILLAIHTPAIFRVVFHDYLAAVTTIIWLFIFWWFSYSFVLKERQVSDLK